MEIVSRIREETIKVWTKTGEPPERIYLGGKEYTELRASAEMLAQCFYSIAGAPEQFDGKGVYVVNRDSHFFIG